MAHPYLLNSSDEHEGRISRSARTSSGRSGSGEDDDIFDIDPSQSHALLHEDNHNEDDGVISTNFPSPATSNHSFSRSISSQPPSVGDVLIRHNEDDDDDELVSEMPPDENFFSPSHSQRVSLSGDPVSPRRHHQSQRGSGSPYTPTKTPLPHPSPFRHPSSVRAMQMDISPPLSSRSYSYRSSPGRHHQARSNWSPSRHGSGSGSSRHNNSSTPRSRSRLSPKKHSLQVSPTRKSTTPKENLPLVLLHVTLLPVRLPYPLELIQSVLPPHLLENYNLLRDKVNETVLERGILLPHPKEDYELLEERLLESLELKVPRILKCGHFHAPEEEEGVMKMCDHRHDSQDKESHVESGMQNDDDHGDGEDKNEKDDGDEDEIDEDICQDCGRHVRDGKMGDIGQGSRRWDIKIFAANGLMRSGAWSAAWKQMERVDVEIEPFIPEKLWRELKMRNEELEARKIEQHEEEEVTMGRGTSGDRYQENRRGRRSAPHTPYRASSSLSSVSQLVSSPLKEQKIILEEEEIGMYVNEELPPAMKNDQEARLREIYGAAVPPPRPSPEAIDFTEQGLENQHPFSLDEHHHIPPLTEEPRHVHEDGEEQTEPWRPPPTMKKSRQNTHSQRRPRYHNDNRGLVKEQIPLKTLLGNYILLVLQDKRNLVIMALSVLVFFLAKQSSNAVLSSPSTLSTSTNSILENAGSVIDSLAGGDDMKVGGGVDRAVPGMKHGSVADDTAGESHVGEGGRNEERSRQRIADGDKDGHEKKVSVAPVVSIVTTTVTATASAIPRAIPEKSSLNGPVDEAAILMPVSQSKQQQQQLGGTADTAKTLPCGRLD
ncbi:MAG: hypothetical protein M1823_000686 [Watsoniomyces obsoletus]|nr:MAG: hypothetical protein M1823_000686 [Watsoniomyces obsoletus]